MAVAAPRTNAVSRPPTGDLVLMVVGLLGVSTSGPLIAATAAPALAVAFWRNAFGTAAIGPYALLRCRQELGRLGRRQLLLAAAAGALLSAHFATWVPSLRYTSVASATALVAGQPIWTAMLARVSGHRVPRRAWTGMAVALLGVLVLTGVDVSLSSRALLGDGLALVGGMFAAAYMVVGGEVRRSVSTTSYTLLCYSACALVLLAVCLLGGQALGGYVASDWAKLLALTVAAQLLGHSIFNLVLRSTSPTVVAVALLFEVPGAAVIAALWLGQRPPWQAVPALALLLAGLAVVVSARDRDETVGVPVAPGVPGVLDVGDGQRSTSAPS